MNISKNILICPLEWGLGHAGRMIPLAKKLRELGNNVFIASGEDHLQMFREEVDGLYYIRFPGFKPRYSASLPQYLALLAGIPALIRAAWSEHKELKKIITDNSIDIVISDNRFGLWNKSITSVYVTHMPLIPFPAGFRFLEWTGIFLHRWIITRYSFCLIPDLPGAINLTGRLSHGIRLPANTRFIGILSRFAGRQVTEDGKIFPSPRRTVILSGPEPQKTILRSKIASVMGDSYMTTVILEGRPEKGIQISTDGNLISCSHLAAPGMENLLSGSDLIICRPGYTTLMELVSLNCSAFIIPTPGQTEQEYLAKYLSAKGWFRSVRQKDIGICTDFSAGSLSRETREIPEKSGFLLDKALSEILHDRYQNDQTK